jgi:hypothetical protein
MCAWPPQGVRATKLQTQPQEGIHRALWRNEEAHSWHT